MSTPKNLFKSTVQWLDARGRGAWIMTMILGFIAFWPFGLAILFYMLWSKRMCQNFFTTQSPQTKSGNSAFDKYKEDTIARLNEEQNAFQGFLQRLRDAKDQKEFDQFMAQRTKSQKPAKA